MKVDSIESKVKDDNFIVIQGWMLSKLHLTGNDLLVYAIIYGFTQDGHSTFKGSQKYLADWCNCTERGIKHNLANLKEDGLIEEVCVGEHGIIEYRAIIDKTERDDPKVKYEKNEFRGEQCSYERVNNVPNGVNNVPMRGEQCSYNNIDNKIENNIDKKDRVSTETKDNDLITNYVNDFSNICVSYPKIRSVSGERKKAIRKLIKAYSYDDILLVLHKAEESDFLTNRNGTNQNGWKSTFDWILNPNNFIKILEGNYDNRKSNRRKFGETINISAKQVTDEEIANGYFTNEKF